MKARMTGKRFVHSICPGIFILIESIQATFVAQPF
jgi:hypothetical protein